MEIHNNLQAMVLRPAHRLLQIRELSLYVGLAGRDIERPETDRHPDVVQTRSSDICKVLFGDPGVPVLLKCGLGGGFGLILAERPFVDDAITGFLEQTGCDPWLH
jgi:hypothetical protein